jgi:hypothetical protein
MTMELAPLFLFLSSPGPNVPYNPWIANQGPVGALAEASTEEAPPMRHVWFPLRPRPHLEASVK